MVWNTQPEAPEQGSAAVPSNPREGEPSAPPSPATTLDAEDGDLAPDVFVQVRAVVFGKPKSGIPVG